MPDVVKSEEVLIVEGEKDVDNLRTHGFVATTCPMGAGKWRPQYNDALKGKELILIPDNDPQGREHMDQVAISLNGAARTLKWLALPGLPPKGDVSDWLAKFEDPEEVKERLAIMIENAEPYTPPKQTMTEIKNTSASEDEVLLQYHLTDVGNAESFHQLHGSKFLYAKEKKLWLHFNRVRWEENEEAVKQAMIKTMRYKTEMALKIFPPNSEQMKKMVQWSLSSESNYKLSQALNIASIYVSKSTNEFDTDPMLLACANGVIDLRTGSIRQAMPSDMLQRSTNIIFDPEAQCIRWQQFLLEVFQEDLEMIDFVQRAIGYTLTGLTKEQCLFLLYGVGANGKSTFLEILQKVTGEYGLTARFETFRDRKYEGIPTEIARMAGARFVKSIETKEGAKINEERVKVLTGGDKISARFLYGREFDFYPICKIWIAVNHKPPVTDTTISYWRRMREIDFEVNFEGREDKELPQKLESELCGILAWAVRGCLNYQSQGLEPIEKIKKATEQYRYDSDVLNHFIDQKLVIDRSKEIKASDLYAAYKQWVNDNGEYLLTSRMFSRRMVEKDFSKDLRGSYVYYRGIELR